jgi:2-iminobutanoate/2-iminopropanoate deaminase
MTNDSIPIARSNLNLNMGADSSLQAPIRGISCDGGLGMAKEIIRTDKAPQPPASYSQAVKASGLIFVAGQGPFDPRTGVVVGATIQEQTRQCMKNIEAILEAAGSSMDRVVSTTFILGDPNDFAGMNEEWLKWFGTDPPARQGAKLPIDVPGLKISIAAIAHT